MRTSARRKCAVGPNAVAQARALRRPTVPGNARAGNRGARIGRIVRRIADVRRVVGGAHENRAGRRDRAPRAGLAGGSGIRVAIVGDARSRGDGARRGKGKVGVAHRRGGARGGRGETWETGKE